MKEGGGEDDGRESKGTVPGPEKEGGVRGERASTWVGGDPWKRGESGGVVPCVGVEEDGGV